MNRIGIYAGTFDPVHIGHITFAMQSLQVANLDKVYFLPERRPRAKQQVEHFGHRVAMLKKAIKPHPQFDVLELVDVSFSIDKTLPFLKTNFSQSELVFLFGSDVVMAIADWPNSSKLLKSSELVVGIRSQDSHDKLKKIIENWPAQPKLVTMFESFAPDVSSGKVRDALRNNKPAKGVLKSVERYSNHHWLYVTLT